MPGSQVTSVVSATSINSGKFSKRYRTKSKQSTVDESLFGGSNKAKSAGERSSRRDVVADKPRPQKQKQETFLSITKDLIRPIRIPRDDPSGLTVVLHRNKFVDLKEKSRFRTDEEIRKIYDTTRKNKLDALEEAAKRKEEMKERDLKRRANAKLNDLEQDAKEKAEYLLTKAGAQLLENEEEIKKTNTFILTAKCHAIRDAQLLEQLKMKNETAKEDLRLDTMMEVDRINAIKAAEDIEEMKQRQRFLGAQQLMKQIQSNAEERVLAEERKDQETKIVLKKLEELHALDQKDLDRKRAGQAELKREMLKCNEDQQRNRERAIAQEKLAEFKALEYRKKKDEEADAAEAEKLRQRKEKEAEMARLRALQEKALDGQAEKDALRVRRMQEEAEREWRRKEEEQALKNLQNAAMMRQARQEQIQYKEHYMAVEAQRDRDNFKRVLTEQKAQIEKDKEREEKLRAARYRNGDFVRGQIRDKEQLQIDKRRKFFEEGVRQEEEARLRRNKLLEVKNKKLHALREAGIPLKYCSTVERKIHAYDNGLMPAI